jgi:hypothetical protein
MLVFLASPSYLLTRRQRDDCEVVLLHTLSVGFRDFGQAVEVAVAGKVGELHCAGEVVVLQV